MKTIIISISLFIGGYFFYENTSLNTKCDEFKIETINTLPYNGVDGDVTIITVKKNKLSYKITNKNHRDFDFYINANYFDKKDVPIGEVKINGKNMTKKNNGGGFFTTDGKTPKFYFGNRPNDVKYSAQTHTPVITNGKLNNKLFNKGWARKRLPRLIMGENKSGDIIILHTRDNCRLSISELTNIAKKFGVYNGLMFDGGASIEVGIKKDGIKYHYQIVNDLTRVANNVPTPKVFIVGTFL